MTIEFIANVMYTKNIYQNFKVSRSYIEWSSLYIMYFIPLYMCKYVNLMSHSLEKFGLIVEDSQ